ncbi:MAG: adenosylcobinamide-GDP ribazoletransferase [Candidatus Omnitrophota bacterium]
MRSLLLAIQFLTIIPVKIKNVTDKNFANSMVYFPVAGLLIGLILAAIAHLLSILNFQYFVSNIILVISLVIITGGIHLDGLSDTSDALLSRKDKDEMLRIMRDSHIGVMGALSIICIILLKISFLSSINSPSKFVSLVLMCTLSRWSLVLMMFSFPYAREEGKAKVFVQGVNLKILTLATVIALGIAVSVWQLKGLLIFALTAIGSYVIGKSINDKIKGLTGDSLGAINELIEVIILFGVCILERSVL